MDGYEKASARRGVARCSIDSIEGKSRNDHSQGCSCNCQLRRDLAPIAQTTDEHAGREFVGHNNFVAWIQTQTIELSTGELPVNVIRRYYNAVCA